MHEAPRGTVTFLLTDIEDSTRLWHQYPQGMPAALARHDESLRAACLRQHGLVYKTVGDALQVAFSSAQQAANAALDAQRMLQAETWPIPEPLRIRMVLHSGTVEPQPDGDYRSPVLNRPGRLLGIGHGGQILLTRATRELLVDQVPPEIGFLDLGNVILKGLPDPERVFQLLAPGIIRDFPVLRGRVRSPSNLRPQPTRFVGRVRDVEQVRLMLLRPDVRLLTLTGPGGIGKTRLAVQAAEQVRDCFEDGVFVVHLENLSNPALLPSTIARVFDLKEESDASIGSRVLSYLETRRMLLILDNFEQLTEAADFPGEIIGKCPGITLLITSRVPLHLRWEHEYPVPPLELPDIDVRSAEDEPVVPESIQMFVDRAQRVRPDFGLTTTNLKTIGDICIRLDGLPLAIELAAARIRALTPDAMLARLSSRLNLLTGGERDLHPRQQTLRQAIAWSYDLLGAREQMVFRRLCVFAGGATLDGVLAVTVPDTDQASAFDAIESLAQQNLVRQSELAGEPRYSLFETIREFGLEQLDRHQELASTMGRHAQYVANLASGYRSDMPVPAYTAWLDRMHAEQDNIRAAATWAIKNDVLLANRLIERASRFWQARGHFEEGYSWALRAVELPDEHVPRFDRAKTLRNAATYLTDPATLPQDRQRAEEALQILRDLGDIPEIISALSHVSILAELQEQHDEAYRLAEEAIDLARDHGDKHLLAHSLNNHGFHAYLHGNMELARTLLDEALVLTREAPSTNSMVYIHSVADVRRMEGRLADAERLYVESLELAAIGRVVVLMSANLMSLVMIAADTGRHDRAALLGGVNARLTRTGDFVRSYDLRDLTSDHDVSLARVFDHLGAARFQRIWDHGASLSQDEALREATHHLLHEEEPSWN